MKALLGDQDYKPLILLSTHGKSTRAGVGVLDLAETKTANGTIYIILNFPSDYIYHSTIFLGLA